MSANDPTETSVKPDEPVPACQSQSLPKVLCEPYDASSWAWCKYQVMGSVVFEAVKRVSTMKTARTKIFLTAALVWALAATTAQAQTTPKMKMTTDIPPSITTPDKVETRIGTLKFFDGFPDKATVEKVYDNLDFQRGLQAYLTALLPFRLRVLAEALLSSAPSTRPSSSPSNCWTPNRCS
jgi:hypothetical protein